MRRHRLFTQQPVDEAQIDMTPMLDIVFIMLIFFIVSTSFVHQSQVKIERPSAHSGQPVSAQASMLSITADGQIWLSNEALSQAMLPARLAQFKATHHRAVMLIEVDKHATTGTLIAVIDQLRLAGIKYRVATTAGAQ